MRLFTQTIPNHLQLNFDPSSLAVVVAEAASADEANAQDCIAKSLAERERVSSLMEKMGYSSRPSRANFARPRCHAARRRVWDLVQA